MPKRGALEKVINLFHDTYLIKDAYAIKMLLCTVGSQWIKGDPVWVMMVAPSGGNKTALISSLDLVPNIHPLSTLTGNTLMSGQKGKTEASLLLNIGSGIITFKDFTSLLSEHPDVRAVIMAQLREIYDGRYVKALGTGELKVWEGKITVIAGATYIIHSKKQQYTAMGERFLFYNLEQPDREEASLKAMSNQESGIIIERRKEIQELLRDYYTNDYEVPIDNPKVDPVFQQALIELSEMCTRSRSDVERDWRSPQKEIIEVYPPEMPTRMATQLQNFSRSVIVYNWNEHGVMNFMEGDMNMINRFTLDSISKSRRTALQELARYEMITTSGLAVKINLPSNSVRRTLEDLNALGICQRYKKTGNRGDDWNIIDKYRTIISKFDNIKVEGGALEATSTRIEQLPDEPAVIPDELKKVARGEVKVEDLKL